MHNINIYSLLSLQYILLLLLFGVFPKSTVMFLYISEIIAFTIIAAINLKKVKRLFLYCHGGKMVLNSMALLFVLSIIYLLLSYGNFADYWQIYNLGYDASYIPRHFFIIAQFFISIGLALCLYRSGFIFNVTKFYVLLGLIMSFLIIGLDFSNNSKSYITVIFLMLSLLGIYKRFFLVILPIIGILLSGSSTYVIAVLALFSILFFKKELSEYLQHNGMEKIYVFFILIMLIMLIFSAMISDYISTDANSEWRLIVWMNEYRSLAKTYFTGVGFGTAYVSNRILSETGNLNMYFETDKGFSEGEFIVANHSSLINFFYRLGIVGGALFTLFNIFLLKWCVQLNRKMKGKDHDFLWWAMANYIFNFVVILFNPGLEMMQFSVGYQMSLAILFSILFKLNCQSVKIQNLLVK